jgi:2-dehydropantoate 2-reductase
MTTVIPCSSRNIAIFGAGNIGCYVGGRLCASGENVQFIGRQRTADIIHAHGIALSDHRGWHATLNANQINFSTELAAATQADLVLVTVKSAATEEAARLLRPHLKPDACIISLQNGLHNAELLATLLPQHTVLTGMVPFNVAQQAPGHFHQGSEGNIAIENSPRLSLYINIFSAAGLPLDLHTDMKPVQWSKLLFNLNNAINALSGLPLKTELSQRAYRKVLALAQREAIALLQAQGQPLVKLTPLPPHWVPALLNIPDWAFRIAANKMLEIDPLARSSMHDDLIAGRKTEIDYLQGEIIRLATTQGKSAPINTALLQLIHATEQGGRRDWSGENLLAAVQAN